MARQSNDLFSTLRAQGLRKRVARALSEIESSSRGARGDVEKRARQAIKDLRAAADSIEKKLNIGGSGRRSSSAKKAAATRKRAAAKRSSSARKGAAKRARKTTARKTTKRKATKRKSTKRASKKRS